MRCRLVFILAVIALGAFSQEPIVRPVRSAYMVEAGSAHVTNTYLSPLKQAGWQMALSYERQQAMKFDPHHWVMQLGGRMTFGRTRPEWRNAPIWDCDVNLSWGMLWRHDLSTSWQVMAGGYTDLTLGVLYASRNSNNPASAKAAWTIGPRIALNWNRNLGRIPVTLSYRAEMPLTGCFFSPQYGQLYYEIYLGDHSGLAHAAWPGNFFRLRNLLYADLRFGNTTLRLGYRCNIESTKTNHIVNNSVAHTAVLGIVCDWISLSPGRRISPDAKIIY